MKEINDLNRIIEKYKFMVPVPGDVQKFVYRSRMRVLKKNLKKIGVYSSLTWLAVLIYFIARKFGISPSLLFSKAIAVTISVTVAGSLAAGSAIAVKQLLTDNPAVKPDEKKVEHTINKVRKRKPASSKNLQIDYEFGVRHFQARDIDKKIAANITDLISIELSKLKGQNKVVNFRKKGGRAQKELIGSITKLGNIYIISAKLVDKSSNILLAVKKQTDNLDDLNSICMEIVKDVTKN